MNNKIHQRIIWSTFLKILGTLLITILFLSLKINVLSNDVNHINNLIEKTDKIINNKIWALNKRFDILESVSGLYGKVYINDIYELAAYYDNTECNYD